MGPLTMRRHGEPCNAFAQGGRTYFQVPLLRRRRARDGSAHSLPKERTVRKEVSTQSLNASAASAMLSSIADELSRKASRFRGVVLGTRLFIARVGERERWWPSRLWDGAGDVALKPLFPETWGRQRLVLGHLVARTAEDVDLKRTIGDTRQSLFRLDPAFDAMVDYDLRLVDLATAARLDSTLSSYTGPWADGLTASAALVESVRGDEGKIVATAFTEICVAYAKMSVSRWSPPALGS